MITEDRVRLVVNTFLSYKALSPNGTYWIRLQKGLDLIIKYLIKVRDYLKSKLHNIRTEEHGNKIE